MSFEKLKLDILLEEKISSFDFFFLKQDA